MKCFIRITRNELNTRIGSKEPNRLMHGKLTQVGVATGGLIAIYRCEQN